MYSMKRRMYGVPLKWRAMGTISCSFMPALTTMLILMGPRPAACAASMPCSTSATAKSTSFMRLKVASSSESSDTVTRFRPASLSACAFLASKEPLVVRVRSSGWPDGVRSAASMAMSFSIFLRSSGSPPVRRIFSTPCATNRRAMRVISSNDSKSVCGRYTWFLSNTSFGMQYTQRKLQRSVIEMRKSCRGRPRLSATLPLGLSSVAGIAGAPLRASAR
ncbi:hypothetical protein D3C72_1670360 [compost metagenome]